MIRFLAYLFLAMAAYGVFVGHLGGAILAFFMWGLMHYAQAWFTAMDQAYSSSPERAPAQPSTSDALQAAESECMADKI